MKLLLGVADLDLANGGLSVVAQRLAAELASQSHTVTLAYSVDPRKPRLPIPPGVEALEFERAGPPWQLWRRCRRQLCEFIERWRPEVVHDHGLWRPENAALQQAAIATGRPLLVQPCGMLQDWPMQQSRLKKQLAWRLYQRAALAGAEAVIVTSEAEQRETLARLPAGSDTALIPHGVELPEIAVDAPRARQAVYLGRLHPKKQVDVLLRSWARLRPAGWRLLIAGSGEQEHVRQLHQLAAANDLGETVQFLGAVHGEAKRALLASSQLFLQPSRQENFGLAVAEALAHSLPVLTTHGMPWAEVVGAGCGWWVDSGEMGVQAALAQALSLRPEQLADMGRRGAAFAERYCWAETARQTLSLYRQVVHA